jgi:2-oxoglutarate ferredoxin oxidoreductase subunit delta
LCQALFDSGKERKLADQAIKTKINGKPEAGEEKVHVFEAWCKKCGICVAFCPTGALTSDENGLPVLTYPEKCTQCGMCELRCPDFAIAVKPREKKEPKPQPTEESK